MVTSRLDVSDFKALVPKMAMEYPFELDDFQKQVNILGIFILYLCIYVFIEYIYVCVCVGKWVRE